MIYKTLHGKLKIVQLESHSKKGRDEYRCSERVSSSYSTSGTPYITLVTNSVICHEWGKDRIVITSKGTYLWSFVTQILYSG